MADFSVFLHALDQAERDKADIQRYQTACSTLVQVSHMNDDAFVISGERLAVLCEATRRCIDLLQKS